jgi:hypothetical protein
VFAAILIEHAAHGPMTSSMRDGVRAPLATAGYCLGCSHPLKGVSEPVCPECGSRFDPSDSRTVGESPFPLRRSIARLAKAIGFVCGLVLVLEILLSAWGGSDLLVWLIALSIAPVMLVGLVLSLIPALFLTWRWRIVGVATPLVLASVLFTDWPFRTLFEAHRARFDAAVAAIEASGALPNGGLQIGPYPILSVQRTPDGNLGFQVSGGSGGGVFLVHPSPSGTFLWWNTNWYEDLGGGWWRVYQD